MIRGYIQKTPSIPLEKVTIIRPKELTTEIIRPDKRVFPVFQALKAETPAARTIIKSDAATR